MEATLATLAWLLAALSAGIWLAAAVLCRGLSRRALAPLSRVVESARGLDAADAGWCLAEAGTGDELDLLGRAFNDLLARLHVAYERQRRFSGDASHQLRTPLTVLIGQLQVALRYDRSGEEYRRALTSALGRAEQLARIVEALLFLGRAEADAGLPVVEPMELHGWVAEHLAGRPPAGREPEVVARACGPDPLWIRAHPALLGQLLDNLLDNAAKHGKADTPVVVETRGVQQEAVLAVEDHGQGIAPEDIPHLFEPFYRSARARPAGRGRSGAGAGHRPSDRDGLRRLGRGAERAGRGGAVRGPFPVDPAARWTVGCSRGGRPAPGGRGRIEGVIRSQGRGRRNAAGQSGSRHPMRLESLSIRDFRGIERLDLSFKDELGLIRDIVPIVGPNTSGKTSILDAIDLSLMTVTEYPLRDGLRLSPPSLVRTGAVRARVSSTFWFSDDEIEAITDVTGRVDKNLLGPEPWKNHVTVHWTFPDPEGRKPIGIRPL